MFVLVIGLAAAIAWLYFWLLGHWFARVLGFLAFAFFLAGAGGLAGKQLSQLTAVNTFVGDARYHGPKVATNCPPKIPVALCDPHKKPAEEDMYSSPEAFLRATTSEPLRVEPVVPAVYAAAFPIAGMFIGVIAAWFVSGIPVYYWRRRFSASAGLA